MAYWTDSCRSKMGRRRPFLFFGAVPYGLFLIMLLYPPPSLLNNELAIWFGCCYIAYYLFNTFTNIPYDALGPEVTDDQDDRSCLFLACQVSLFD